MQKIKNIAETQELVIRLDRNLIIKDFTGHLDNLKALRNKFEKNKSLRKVLAQCAILE